MKEPYDWDEYASNFFPKAEELAQQAAEAEKAGEKEKASELYLYVTDKFFCYAVHHLCSLTGEAQPSTESLASQIQGPRSRNMPGRRARRFSTKVARKFSTSQPITTPHSDPNPACPNIQSAKSKSPTNTPSKGKAPKSPSTTCSLNPPHPTPKSPSS